MGSEKDHERIWLAPKCESYERTWCEDNVWERCVDDECGEKSTEYVRADIAAARLEAEEHGRQKDADAARIEFGRAIGRCQTLREENKRLKAQIAAAYARGAREARESAAEYLMAQAEARWSSAKTCKKKQDDEWALTHEMRAMDMEDAAKAIRALPDTPEGEAGEETGESQQSGQSREE